VNKHFRHIFFPDSGHSTLPGEDACEDMMNRYSPELEADAAEAIQVLESVVIDAENSRPNSRFGARSEARSMSEDGSDVTKKKETDEKFRDLTEVSGEKQKTGANGANWQNQFPGVKVMKK